MSEVFATKDSGQRASFSTGMVRDTTDGKLDYTRVLDGPMFERWAALLDRGAVKYPDVAPGVPNWTLAETEEEFQRFKKSALRHFVQLLRGDRDEDHAAAVFFNVNGMEYTRGRIQEKKAREEAPEKKPCGSVGDAVAIASNQ